MVSLDVATVLLQWATGGLFFLWVTSRRRLVGIGYGWLLRSVYATLAIAAVVVGVRLDSVLVRDVSAVAVALSALVALAVSVVRRRAGVSGERSVVRRSGANGSLKGSGGIATPTLQRTEFPPALDLIAPLIGLVGLIAAGIAAGGPAPLAVARTIVGALFLGAVSDAMLLGHWYLVQPGMPRSPLNELNRYLALVWPFEVALLLVPTGMLSVLSGTIDDGYGGMLGWFWVACAVTTLVLCFVTKAALKERAYSAVMAATGLLYLAILTAFGTDLVARALLAQG